jgi:hypothetical protein
LAGEFSHTSRTRGVMASGEDETSAAGEMGIGVAPASRAPTSYVG